MRIGIVIPALNEQASIREVIIGCQGRSAAFDEIRVVVCDNGSSDETVQLAEEAGAEVVHEAQRGYGAACLQGIRRLGDWPEVLVFMDADGSSDPADIDGLVQPLSWKEADLCLGRRSDVEPGSMSLPQRWGNWLACSLIRFRWGQAYRDCGPLRAIRRVVFERLGMRDRSWGWNVEMQIKAVLNNLAVVELPVSWRKRRGGRSKISGTTLGAVRAGGKILWTFLRYAPCFRRAAVASDIALALVKYPQAGQVKTRLAASIGDERAVEVYKDLAEHTHRQLMKLQFKDLAELALYTDGQEVPAFKKWLPGARHYWVQSPGDLGTRLRSGFARAFAAGARRVAAVGTDCPGMSAGVVEHAFERLVDADVAIAPSNDGGYSLIALKKQCDRLFEGIQWSTEHVLEETLGRAKALRLKVARLPAIADVDHADDLVHLQKSEDVFIRLAMSPAGAGDAES